LIKNSIKPFYFVSLKLKKCCIVCGTNSITTIVIKPILVHEFFMEKLNLQSLDMMNERAYNKVIPKLHFISSSYMDPFIFSLRAICLLTSMN
jgi:hypothetical protein